MSQLNKFRFANIVIGLVFAAPFTATTFAQSRPAPTPMPRPVVSAPEIKPPPTVRVQAPSKSVVLGPGAHSENIKMLTVKRQFDVSQLRANPVIMLGKNKVNLASVFNNRSALPNVATRLRAMPQLAEVMNEHMQVVEVEQGLIVRHYMSYRLKPGTCSDPVRRASLSSSGVRCAAKITDETRAAAFATKGDAHYIADPRLRAMTIADAKKKSGAMRQHVANNLTKLRAALNNPAERAKIDSLRGAGESARLSKLSDDELKAEVINSGVTQIEHVAFVPNPDKVYTIQTGNLYLRGAGITAVKPTIAGQIFLNTPLLAAPTPVTTPDRPLDQQIFLTGFTLGNDYEWSQRIEKTVSWCFVGCDETYYAEAHAGFNYGFGLRFPIQVNGTYHYQAATKGKPEQASVTTDFVPILGTHDNFAATGLEESKIFDGKEFVAQFGAHVGASFHLPDVAMALMGLLPGTASIPPDNDTCDGTIYAGARNDLCLGYDFTEQLLPPFKDGRFTPPAPNQPDLTVNQPFPFDLLGGRANFGIIGVQVFPAVQIGLHSDSLKFTLTDNNNITNPDTPLTSTHLTTNLKLDGNHTSNFTIKNPVYNLGLDVTPGIDAHAFIDIEVWSDSWDWFIWLPQLTIHLPPGGKDFACHDGTHCSRDYSFTPTSQKSTEGAEACSKPDTPACFNSDLDNWSKGFDAQWLPQCIDDTCKVGLKLVRLGVVLSANQQHEADLEQNKADPKLKFSDVTDKSSLQGAPYNSPTYQAQVQARTLIQESQGRKTADELEANRDFILAIWSAKCSDKLCFDNVAAITKHEQVDVGVRHALAPDDPNNSVFKLFAKVSKEYGNKQLQAEIDASTARAAAAARPAMRIRRPS